MITVTNEYNKSKEYGVNEDTIRMITPNDVYSSNIYFDKDDYIVVAHTLESILKKIRAAKIENGELHQLGLNA